MRAPRRRDRPKKKKRIGAPTAAQSPFQSRERLESARQQAKTAKQKRGRKKKKKGE